MKLFNYTLILVAGLATSYSTFAASSVKDFTVGEDKQKIKVLVPEGWDSYVNLLNTPLSLVSKKGLQDQASVIQVVPFGVKDTDDTLKEIQKDPDSYYTQKEESLEGLDGDIISYEPYEETKNKDGSTVYSIGVKYKTELGEFADNTYYISTKSKELFYIKTLVPLDQEKEHGTIVSQVIDSVSSKN